MNKKKTIGLIAFALILIFLISLFLSANYFAPRIISKQVQKLTQGKYQLTFDDFKVILFPLGVEATGIHLVSEDSVFIRQESGKNILPEIRIKEVKLHGLHILKLLFEKILVLDKNEITDPEIILTYATDSVSVITLDSKQGGGLKGFRAEKIMIHNGKFTGISDESRVEGNIEFSTENISLLGQSQISFDSLLVAVSNFKYLTPDGFYSIDCDSAFLKYPSETVTLHKIKINPLVGKYEIGKIKGFETDWDSASIELIDLKGFDIDKALRDSIFIQSVQFKNIHATIFRDKRLPFPTIPDTKLPAEVLAEFGKAMCIDSLFIIDSDITYLEQTKDERPGRVSFNSLEVHGGPLSNIGNTTLKINAKTKIMNKGLLEADFSFPSIESNSLNTARGTLHKMDVRELNPMFIWVADLNIKSGMIHRMDFDFGYNNFSSHGEMRFSYEELVLEFIESENKEKKSKFVDKILSLITNTILIKKSNLPGKNFRVGEINFERDPKKSLFNYWWKSTLSGIKSSTGLDKKK